MRPKLESKKAEILDAARRVAIDKGLFRTEIKDILAESGVSSATLYKYFDGGRDQLLRLLVEEIRDDTLSRFPFILANSNGVAGKNPLIEAARGLFYQTDRYGRVMVELMSDAAPEFARGITDVEGYYRFIGKCFKNVKAKGRLREEIDTRQTVQLFIALIHPEHFLQRRQSGKSIEEILYEAIDAITACISKNPEEARKRLKRQVDFPPRVSLPLPHRS